MSRNVSSSFKGLSLKTQTKTAESWDEDLSDTESSQKRNVSDSAFKTPPDTRPTTAHAPAAPPPTPASPRASTRPHVDFSSLNDFSDFSHSSNDYSNSANKDTSSSDRRPDKTTATASRMIAAGLGMKAPKRTEDEKAYDKAMKEKERTRRDDEKRKDAEYKENERKARAAMWDD